MSASRRSLFITAITAGLAVLFATSVWLAMGDAIPSTGPDADITQVTYSQQKAVPNFDQSVHVVTDPAKLIPLQDALRDANWVPGSEEWSDDDCEGGTRTMMTITSADGTERDYDGYRCDGSPEIVNAIDGLIASW